MPSIQAWSRNPREKRSQLEQLEMSFTDTISRLSVKNTFPFLACVQSEGKLAA